MRNTIHLILLAALLALGAGSAQAFSLIGSLGPNPGGEPWQQTVIGHDLPGDVGGVHNIGEEYRRVTPVMYYAYNANFLGYFGLSGAANCDAAFSIMNSVIGTNNVLGTNNISSYTAALDEFPFDVQAQNPTAQSLLLTDLKSVTLIALLEQMGLAEPERYVWTLHDRLPGNGSPCLLTVTYLVVMRNFNILDTPLNQVQYSAYVNDFLYTYYISEVCSGSPVLAVTVPVPADSGKVNLPYTSVAGGVRGLQYGGFYTGLTKDDVAGLRYLISSNNINWEATAPSGGLLLSSNALAQTTLTTLPLSLLFGQASVTDPATLLAIYPGLTYISVTTNLVNLFSTNLVAYYTNLVAPFTNSSPNFPSWSPVQYGGFVVPNPVTFSLGEFLAFVSTNDPASVNQRFTDLVISQVITNSQQLLIITNRDPYYTNQTVMPVYTNNLPGGLAVGYYFTNQPGPTIIDYPRSSQLLTNLDLLLFAQRARTNDPVTLKGFYPDLVILSSFFTPTNADIPNIATYFTNYAGQNIGTPPTLVTVSNGFTRIFFNQYYYSFGNVITNHAYVQTLATVVTTSITNHVGANVGTPNVTNVTSVSYYTNVPVYPFTNNPLFLSGDILIIPTNWCGFQVTATYSPIPTMGVSNNLVFASAALGTNSFQYSRSIYYTFTNLTYNITPGICEPKLVFQTNSTTNIVNSYQYSFGNVVTNHYYTNTFVSVSSTNISSIAGGFTNTMQTNVAAISFYTNLPSGDIFIVPQAWCGYTVTNLFGTIVATTNVFIPGGIVPSSGQSYIRTTIFYYTNYTLSIRPGFCEPALVFATNYSTNLVTTYTYVFGGIVTNRYNPNSLVKVVTTNLMLVPFGLVGALTNIVTTNFINVGPGGDFYIVPPAWCFVKSNSLLNTAVTTTTNQFAATNVVGPDLGQRYTLTTYTTFTNNTILVTPYVCSSAPASPSLRRGIERIQFIRANFDSLLGQFFQPQTNIYNMTVITNSQQLTETYQRVITTPDFLFSAQDFATSPSDPNLSIGVLLTRNLNFDTSQNLPNLKGPGTIFAPTTFTFNKVGPGFYNGPFVTNVFTSVNEFSQTNSHLNWASFDTSTNSIVLYPNGTSLANLANSIFIQVSPATIPDGNVGGSYSLTFSATGGQPPYTWLAPNLSSVVPGLVFDPNPAAPTIKTASGFPLNQAGSFNFIIRLTDSVNRTVDYNYTITIH